MVRLPQPGSDAGSWGTILNDFLSTAHNNDGTIKTASISEDKLDSAVQAKLNLGGGGGSGTVTAADITDATATGRDILTAADAGEVRTTIGLGNVSNTSDTAKPISTATQAALDLKANAGAVATALGDKIDVAEKGVANGVATLGEGGLVLPEQLATGTGSGSTFLRGDGVWGVPGGSGGGGTVDWIDITNKPVVIASGATQAAARSAIGAGTSSLALAGTGSATTASKSDHTHTISNITATGTASATTYLRGDGSWATPAGGGTVTAANITDATTIGRSVLTSADAAAVKTAIGLGNVTNTTDANKPISTATQTALNGKANTSHTHTIANITTTGTASASTYLRGDGSWATPAGGGGGSSILELGPTDPVPGGTASGTLIIRLPEEG